MVAQDARSSVWLTMGRITITDEETDVPVIHWLRVEVTKAGNRRYEWRLLDTKGNVVTDSYKNYDADYDAAEYTADCRGRGGTYYRQQVAEAHAQDVRVAYEHRLGEVLEATLEVFGRKPEDLDRVLDVLKALAEDKQDRRALRAMLDEDD